MHKEVHVRINTNAHAFDAWRPNTPGDPIVAASLGRLDSGLRVARSGQDSLGLSLTISLEGRFHQHHQALRETQGGLDDIEARLTRVRDLAAQSRPQLRAQVDALVAELDEIARRANLDGLHLLAGTATMLAGQLSASDSAGAVDGAIEQTKGIRAVSSENRQAATNHIREQAMADGLTALTRSQILAEPTKASLGAPGLEPGYVLMLLRP